MLLAWKLQLILRNVVRNSNDRTGDKRSKLIQNVKHIAVMAEIAC